MTEEEKQPAYESADEARQATSSFYAEKGGFGYDADSVAKWLNLYLEAVLPKLRQGGKVLDLCCGDGVWSRGLKALRPDLELHGIDIATGGIEASRRALPDDADRFVVGDAEAGLPWPEETFDLVFARGPGLYNQHDMDRPGAIAVLEMWHRSLRRGGVAVSIFYSDPEKFGTYTNPLKVALPYNRAPRLTEAVDFTGGKYHHDVQSFLAPFRKARNVRLGNYRFVRKNHILESRLLTE